MSKSVLKINVDVRFPFVEVLKSYSVGTAFHIHQKTKSIFGSKQMVSLSCKQEVGGRGGVGVRIGVVESANPLHFLPNPSICKYFCLNLNV